ncbi:CbtA family protein [Gordonia sp. (in: high G+C Gram-positive bacteria)]|uniref:CbtA family protein n=1 Tax=Gordonia sp. (in: high G+C Gram-positive bacteria) TaxID=84139 RepID=UPI003C767C6A
MNARAFLVRGLIAGLLAGIATFFVAYAVGESQVETAIGIETAAEAGHTHSHDDSAAEVSRETQKTWGLLTGTVGVGVALGGIVALIAAATLGRLGRLQPGGSTALIVAIGFVAFALVPFLKYPATPPAVGSGDTIGGRTILYFGFVAISVAAAAGATYAAVKLREKFGTYTGVVSGIAIYLLVVVVAGNLFSTVNEVGDFPADTLWFFRRASLLTLATMWGVIGVVLTGLVSRLYAEQSAQIRRQEFAASL